MINVKPENIMSNVLLNIEFQYYGKAEQLCAVSFSANYLVPKLLFGNAYVQCGRGGDIKQSLRVGIPKPELGNEKSVIVIVLFVLFVENY